MTEYIVIKGKPIKKKDEKKEFELALKAFKKFINNGFHRKFFTKRIYEFLYLKCRFIAHYGIDNFYITYFTDIQGFNKFVEKMNELPTNQIIEELNKFTKN